MAIRKKSRVQPGNDGVSGRGSTGRTAGSGGVTSAFETTNWYTGDNQQLEGLLHHGGVPDTGLQLSGTSNNQANYGNLLDWLGVSNPNEFLKILSALGVNLPDMDGAQKADWNKQLLDNAIAQLAELDKRKYNEGIRNEQRLYDNPLNQLARLMGAGISRDAAIQMLSAGGGSGSGGLVTGDAAVTTSGIPASQSSLNQVQQQTAIANTVFSGIQTISGLVGLGFTIPQALAQTKSLQFGNAMSQKALLGLQSADAVLGALENAVSIGALSTKDMDGFSNATDALNYIFDHQDSAAFKPIFDNGAFGQVYGSKLGREMFAQAWDNVRQSKDAGTILDQYISHGELSNSLAEVDNLAKRRDYFFGFQHQLNSLIMEDEQILNLWNQFQNGQVLISINGEVYKQNVEATKQSKLATTSAQRASYTEGVQFDAFKNFVENGEPIEPDASSSGRAIINYMTFANWYNQLQKMLVTTSKKPFTVTDPNKPVGSVSRFSTHYPREDYANYLRKHQDLLYTGAFLQQVIQSGRLNSFQGDSRPIWQFFDMWNYSGASDMVTTTATTAADLALPFVLPKAPVLKAVINQ